MTATTKVIHVPGEIMKMSANIDDDADDAEHEATDEDDDNECVQDDVVAAGLDDGDNDD